MMNLTERKTRKKDRLVVDELRDGSLRISKPEREAATLTTTAPVTPPPQEKEERIVDE